MKILIDLDEDLSPDLQVLLHLYKLDELELATQFEARNSPDNLQLTSYKERLIKKGYINSVGMVNNLKKSSSINVDDFIKDLIEDYRNKFKNKKSGAIGDKNAIVKKFKKFLEEYPEFADKSLILSATDRYISSQMVNGYKYLMQADYFIYKNKGDNGGNISTLAGFCEEVSNLGEQTSNLTLF
jgi:hypothetical protein